MHVGAAAGVPSCLIRSSSCCSSGHRSRKAVQASSSNGSGSWTQAMASCNPALFIPISVMTDSYKASHFLQYPKSKKMVAVSLQQTQHGQQPMPETSRGLF